MTLNRIPTLLLLLAATLAGACGGGTQLTTDDDVAADTPVDGVADTPADVPIDGSVDGTPDVPGEDGGETGPVTCGPWPGGGCPDGAVCDIRSCGDGAGGLCVPDPGGACPEVFSPVCGCDGVTYDNDCFRVSAGIAFDHLGDCDAVRCGGIGDIRCVRGEVCDIRSCDFDAEGFCVPRPPDCPDRWDPVCGCDGVTYANDCDRLVAGAAWYADGECGSSGTCGGVGGIPCADGEVCDIRYCFPDAAGRCVPRPVSCSLIYDPVCGCDGRTYGNDCLRLQSGVALDYVGECGGEVCMPQCERIGGGRSAWVDDCTGTTYCTAPCDACRAVCRHVDSWSEGWYAECDGSVSGGCEPGIPDLITYADCG